MVDSGIKVDNALVAEFGGMEVSTKLKLDYIVMTIQKPAKLDTVMLYKKVEIGESKKQFEDSGTDLKGVDPAYQSCYDLISTEFAQEPAYILIYVPYEEAGKSSQNKLVLICWIPDGGPMKKKMVYSSTKDSVKKKVNNLNATVVINSLDDLKFKAMQETVSGGKASK